jgi:hypothetical protein
VRSAITADEVETQTPGTEGGGDCAGGAGECQSIETQLALPGLAEVTGLAELPLGFSELNRKQQTFVQRYLAHGNTMRAAREAGYADPESEGHRLSRRPAIAAVLAQAGARVAKDADALLRRAMERSVWLHNELREQRAKRMDSANGVGDTRRERELFEQCARADTLVAALLGKLNVNVNGSIEHNHRVSVVPEETRRQLLSIQREIGFAGEAAPAALEEGRAA